MHTVHHLIDAAYPAERASQAAVVLRTKPQQLAFFGSLLIGVLLGFGLLLLAA